MYFIFDTETTTFPNSNLPCWHQAQGRIVQLAALKLDKDFNEVGHLYTLIKPQGWDKISEGAFKQHGITVEKCHAEGRDLFEVMTEFVELGRGCSHAVAHNIDFDTKMMEVEFGYLNHINKHIIIAEYFTNEICTMELTTNICKIPYADKKKHFGKQYKWPKLHEAYSYFFPGEVFAKQHDALADVRATARIFKHLGDTGFLKIPSNIVPLATTQQTTQLNVI